MSELFLDYHDFSFKTLKFENYKFPENDYN